jgi:valine--pyruvate aminotransferase
MNDKSLELSNFGQRFTRRTGTLQLMDDLGAAMSGDVRVHMLGGGNPAAIPAMEEVYRAELGRIALDADEFTRMAGNYAPPEGDIRFRSAVADLLSNQYGWPLTHRNIGLTNGSQSAFFLLFNLLAGDSEAGERKILLPMTPEYIGYADLGIASDFFVSARPAIEEQEGPFFKYHVDFEQLALGPDIAAICVSRPTNPTGNVLTDGEIERLDRLARARGVPLIIDCAYGLPFPAVQYVQASPLWNDNVVLCFSLSKTGLPGLRTGIVVAREEIIDSLGAMTAVASLAPNNAGAVLTHRLVRSGEILNLSREIIRPFYQQRMAEAVQCLDESCSGVPYRVHQPEGAFFLWLWFEGCPISSETLYRRLKARGVIVLSGHHFFPGLAEDWGHRHECLRINYAQPRESVRTGIRLIGEEVRRAYALAA